MSVKIRAWMGVLKQQVMRNESMKIVVLGGRQDENEVLPVNKIQTDDDDTVCVRFYGRLDQFLFHTPVKAKLQAACMELYGGYCSGIWTSGRESAWSGRKL